VVRPAATGLALPAAAAVAAIAAFLLVHDALIDDAHITVSYGRNLGLHLHWGLIRDEVANSATSALNVLLLGAITAVVRDGVVAVGVLFVASIVVATVWLRTLARQLELSRWFPVLAVGLLLVNPLMLSTVGLEPYLCAALVAGLLRYGTADRPVAFGLVGGLAVLARPDLGVLVAGIALVLPGVRRRLLRTAAVALAVVLPWCVFSWFALGSAVPDTLVIKAGSARWGGHEFWTGPLLYYGYMPRAALMAFLPALAGVLVLLVVLVSRVRARWVPWQHAAAAVGLGGIAHYGVYGLLHTSPYHWYYAPLIVGGTLSAAVAVASLRGWRALAPVVFAVLLAGGSLAIDLGHGLPWQRAVIQTNWASPAQYERIGKDIAAAMPGATIESPGEIGTIAYYCECPIVDQFSDRGRVIAVLNEKEKNAGWLVRFLIRLNYANLDRSERPRPVDARLVYQSALLPDGPLQWEARHWAEPVPGRLVLERTPNS
jgi:Predicted protease of the Abi (CAAX) family